MKNLIIDNMLAVTYRAAELECLVVAVIDNVILCHRADNTFITWRVGVYEQGVEFISGCYDMSQRDGLNNLIERVQ